jgi:hypothetical protein
MPRFNSLGVEMLGRWWPDLAFEHLKFLIANLYEVISSHATRNGFKLVNLRGLEESISIMEAPGISNSSARRRYCSEGKPDIPCWEPHIRGGVRGTLRNVKIKNNRNQYLDSQKPFSRNKLNT